MAVPPGTQATILAVTTSAGLFIAAYSLLALGWPLLAAGGLGLVTALGVALALGFTATVVADASTANQQEPEETA